MVWSRQLEDHLHSHDCRSEQRWILICLCLPWYSNWKHYNICTIYPDIPSHVREDSNSTKALYKYSLCRVHQVYIQPRPKSPTVADNAFLRVLCVWPRPLSMRYGSDCSLCHHVIEAESFQRKRTITAWRSLRRRTRIRPLSTSAECELCIRNPSINSGLNSATG